MFANHLKNFSWEPVILAVHEDYYEETLDWNLVKLLPANLRIEKVNAFKNTRPRLIGDIGLRAFLQLYKRAEQLIRTEGFDLLYISIPSFYCGLLGRLLHSSTGIPYGIDYIDPWVHEFPGSEKILSRHWFSTRLAKLLEPIAVKKASLITGVAEGYYKAVLERNPHLKTQAVVGAMPYGGEAQDHAMLQQLDLKPYLFEKQADRLQLVYAGAMLPKAYLPLEAIFKSIKAQREVFANVEFHFIGTGKAPDDAAGYNIKTLAEQYGLWESVVFEYPKRIPYLDVLVHLNEADGIFILGSTEPHYTPSKTYQGVLSEKPIFAVLHRESTAVNILTDSGAGIVLAFDGEAGVHDIEKSLFDHWLRFILFKNQFHSFDIDKQVFESYSAKAVTGQLATLLNEVILKSSR